MKIKEGMFAVKLYELEQQYGRMQSRLHLCQQDDHQKIRRELQRATEEYQEDELLLKKNVENSRSPAVAALAEAQLEYSRRVKEIYDREYAIDFAVQSMRYALMTTLKAIDTQMDTEEEAKKNE